MVVIEGMNLSGHPWIINEIQIGFIFSATPEREIGSVTEAGDPEIGSKKARAKHQMNAVYGSSSKATKTRRCGECEGCMRDDCGQCAACADKPRFGGRGSKKKVKNRLKYLQINNCKMKINYCKIKINDCKMKIEINNCKICRNK